LADFILILHSYNVYLVLATTAITGIWGLILYFTRKGMLPSWRIALIVTAVLCGLQALFGILLVAFGQKPAGGTGLYYLHYVYGAIVALGLPIAITYTTNGEKPRRDVLIFSIAVLIMFAAGIRAFTTGPG
jgi:heme A synthase